MVERKSHEESRTLGFYLHDCVCMQVKSGNVNLQKEQVGRRDDGLDLFTSKYLGQKLRTAGRNQI